MRKNLIIFVKGNKYGTKTFKSKDKAKAFFKLQKSKGFAVRNRSIESKGFRF